MNTVVEAARRLVEHTPGHRVISVFVDLDPERFATAPARASQIRSLIDQAARGLDAEEGLEHEERVALREDLDTVAAYLLSREPPFKGARALAVFCSQRAKLFEVLQLPRPTEGRVVIAHGPYIEPLLASIQQRRWLVVLASRRDARLLSGTADGLGARERIEENVHGQHDQGGWSQANYERSVEQDADAHLRRVAEKVHELWRREHFDRIALGGPQEIVPRLEAMLGEDVRACRAPGRVEVDVSTTTEEQIRDAIADLVVEDEKRLERETLDRLAAGIGSRSRGAGGPEQTIEALNQRRVQTLLLEPGFDGRAGRCPACGLLYLDSTDQCPADGTELEEVAHLREAAVEAALVQDAAVMVVRHFPDLGAHRGIGAVLRF